MAAESYRYVIVGGGLAGASAVEGIREKDSDGPILLISSEASLPYNRPPLTKGLWLGSEEVKDIFVHDEAFYKDNAVSLSLGTAASRVSPNERAVYLADGRQIRYEKLLLATGGTPRRLPIPGSNLAGVCYYRTLEDYRNLRSRAVKGKSAVVIGGGFIGSEIAAALNANGVDVTIIFPDDYLVQRIFPEGLGRAIQEQFRSRGVRVLSGDAAAAIEAIDDGFLIRTRDSRRLETNLVIAGIGITPDVELARSAELNVGNGIKVNDRLQSSESAIYAAGDNTEFPYLALGTRAHVEHWDNALNQGRKAGRNMAGADEPYDTMPFFYSDLFEFGYEAVGEVDSRLEVFADWQEENVTGVLYYLKGGKVRGAMMCNVWDKVDEARALIRSGKPMGPDDLRGAIQ